MQHLFFGAVASSTAGQGLAPPHAAAPDLLASRGAWGAGPSLVAPAPGPPTPRECGQYVWSPDGRFCSWEVIRGDVPIGALTA
eukprot:1812250-Alexandrium_andersonii.AAC.1